MASVAHAPHFGQTLNLDLADPLAGEIVSFPDLIECLVVIDSEPEASCDDVALHRIEQSHQLADACEGIFSDDRFVDGRAALIPHQIEELAWIAVA